MKKLLFVLFVLNLSFFAFSQENTRFLGFNLTSGISSYHAINEEFPDPDLEYWHEASFSNGFDVNYSIRKNKFVIGAAFGIDIIRNKFFLNDDSAFVDGSVQYVGLQYSSMHSQFLIHLSPFVRWNFIQNEKFALFLELQSGIFNRTYSKYNSEFHYSAVYEDYNNSSSEWYSEPYKPVSFSISGKTGLQYEINEKYAFAFSAFYCDYLSSFIKRSFIGGNQIYFRYGIETGIKMKL